MTDLVSMERGAILAVARVLLDPLNDSTLPSLTCDELETIAYVVEQADGATADRLRAAHGETDEPEVDDPEHIRMAQNRSN